MNPDEIEKTGKDIACWIEESGPAWTQPIAEPTLRMTLDNRTGTFRPRTEHGYWWCAECDGPNEWHRVEEPPRRAPGPEAAQRRVPPGHPREVSAMTLAELRLGHAVRPLEGETEIWPTLALAPVGTTVSDNQGHEWARYRKWWAGPDAAQLTSSQLGLRGPLTVRSVHEHEDWIDITSLGSATVTSICASCGATKETPR